MSTLLPLAWENKENKPELESYVAQFGARFFLTAEEINELRDAMNELFATFQGATSFKGIINLATPVPTDPGLYFPEEGGTYTGWLDKNGNPIIIDLTAGFTGIIGNGVVFAKQVIPINLGGYVPKSDVKTLGILDGSNTKIWLDKSKGTIFTTEQLTAIEGIKDFKILNPKKEDYSIRVITKNDPTYGTRIILNGGADEFFFSEPLQNNGAAINLSGLNKFQLNGINGEVFYIEIDFSEYTDGVVLNNTKLFVSKTQYINKQLLGLDVLGLIINKNNKISQIMRYEQGYITSKVGTTRDKIVFPNIEICVVSINGAYYYLPKNFEFEFSADYKVLGIDLNNLPASNLQFLNLIELTAYDVINNTNFIPIVSRWYHNEAVFVYPLFAEFFDLGIEVKRSSFRKNIAVMGDSIMMLMRTDFTTLDTQNWVSLKEKLKLNSLMNLGLGGATWHDKGDTYNTNTPSPDSNTNYISNQIRWLGRQIVSNGKNSPDIIIISVGTNSTTWVDNFDTIMALSFSALESSEAYRMTNYGGMRYSLELLARSYHNAKIIVFSPIQAAPEYTDRTYLILENVKNNMIKMASRYGVKVVNALDESGICNLFEHEDGSGYYLGDGLHPNENGKNLLTNFFALKVLDNYSQK